MQLGGRLVVADSPGALEVGTKNGPPDVGDRAIRMDTLTGDDVGGKLEEISTRIPPAREMLDTNFADVLGKQPVVLLFATPALCQSRTCGPVVDIAEQVRAQNGKGVTFIQQEIFQDNDPGKPRAPAGLEVAPADRAVGVRHRPRRQDQRALRGRLLGRRARTRRGRGPVGPVRFRRCGPVAQWSEQRTHNPSDEGSSPSRPIYASP